MVVVVVVVVVVVKRSVMRRLPRGDRRALASLPTVLHSVRLRHPAVSRRAVHCVDPLVRLLLLR